MEQRAAVRQLVRDQVVRSVSYGRSDHIWWFGRLENLSASGFHLLLRQRFEPGTVLLVELPSERGVSVLRRTARVHGACLQDHNWELECTFLQPLAPEELSAVSRVF